MNYGARQRRLQEALLASGAEAFLVTHPPNLRYLCGFTGSSGALLLARGKRVLFTDGRYTTQARTEAEGVRVALAAGPLLEAAAAWFSRQRTRHIAVEAQHMTLATRAVLVRFLPKRVRLKPLEGLVERLRMVKEPAEVALIRSAVRLGSALFNRALKVLRPGVTEAEVAAEIEYAARRAGAQGMSFETIVAGGRRSALPHGIASSQPIPNKGFVVLDFGVILGGYCSDMTRTVHMGPAPRQAREMYEVVRKAQERAVASVRPGAKAAEVDYAARQVLQEAGLGRYFTHSTGHGLGLEIHEPPRLGKGQAELLAPGMVVTVEPGVYVAGRGGVRIEDVVVVTGKGCEVLTPTPKELIEM
ncbi:MAG: Xaa-Pro peptidase family protein [Acidobacteriota bacterium]|nr:Xaa-Pro peptidase family protein [Acidobacteriota bacterium]